MKSVMVHSYSIKEMLIKIGNKRKEGLKPTVAFVYASVSHNIRKLVAELSNYPFIVFGATTVGEIFANEEFGVNSKEESIICLLLEINPKAIGFRLFQTEDRDAFKVGEDVAKWSKTLFKDPAIITATSGLYFDNDAYTQSIVNNGIEYVFGGAAGDDLILRDTFVFSKENFSNHGVVVLVIDKEKIEIIGSRAFGWAGIGRERIVTKANKNVVYEIDGKPAIDFYKSYLHITSKDMPQTGIEYPLEVIMRDKQTVYRAVLAIDEDAGSLIFGGHVEIKSRVRISAPRGKVIINYVSESIIKAKKDAGDFKPDVALVFPCCSRKQVLGNFIDEEIKAAYQAIGAPLIGFFAYGEIGAFPGGYGYHNETFVTALLKEKD